MRENCLQKDVCFSYRPYKPCKQRSHKGRDSPEVESLPLTNELMYILWRNQLSLTITISLLQGYNEGIGDLLIRARYDTKKHMGRQ